jgi:hypothetical protein
MTKPRFWIQGSPSLEDKNPGEPPGMTQRREGGWGTRLPHPFYGFAMTKEKNRGAGLRVLPRDDKTREAIEGANVEIRRRNQPETALVFSVLPANINMTHAEEYRINDETNKIRRAELFGKELGLVLNGY